MADGYETTSVGAFVQQVAVHCLPHGYRYYVSGFMPEGKDYRAIDERIIAKYEIPQNRWYVANLGEKSSRSHFLTSARESGLFGQPSCGGPSHDCFRPIPAPSRATPA